jgi:hypothetical protein
MNWQVLRPGRVLFEESEPLCFIFPIRKQALLDCAPEIRRQHAAFRASRDEFMTQFDAGDSNSIKQAWQRQYFVGRHPDGTQVDEHINKLRLKEPVNRRTSPVTVDASPRLPTAELSPKIARTDPRWDDVSVISFITQTLPPQPHI